MILFKKNNELLADTTNFYLPTMEDHFLLFLCYHGLSLQKDLLSVIPIPDMISRSNGSQI